MEEKKVQFIDLKAQYQRINSDVQAGIDAVLEHGRYVMGPEIELAEEALAKQANVKHCIALSSGTDALLLALMAADIKPGDEVITTSYSFFSSVEVIVMLGAVPVFVDIDPDTYNIDPKQISAVITQKTKAIMPVNLYGQCADFDPINAIAAEHNLMVIEDAAQSTGGSYKGRPSGGLGHIGCTSFFPSKPLGCYGDGGACYTNDDALALKLQQLRNHGQDRRYHHISIGLNGRMDSMQAAVLLAKLSIFDDEVEKRQQVASWYAENLPETVKPPFIMEGSSSAYALYTIEVDNRDAVQAALNKKGVPTVVHYPMPLYQQPAIADILDVIPTMPIVEKAAARVLSLPFHPYMTEDEVKQVCLALSEI